MKLSKKDVEQYFEYLQGKVAENVLQPIKLEIVAKLSKGEIDLVIGTHRLFGKDVQFKDLGLLILDEEQRFGVEHKEQLKTLKVQVFENGT